MSSMTNPSKRVLEGSELPQHYWQEAEKGRDGQFGV